MLALHVASQSHKNACSDKLKQELESDGEFRQTPFQGTLLVQSLRGKKDIFCILVTQAISSFKKISPWSYF